MGGYAWEKAGQIWYVALRDKLRATTDFQGAANMTFEIASSLYGIGSLEQQAVRKGWAEVGIVVADSGGDDGSSSEPPGCWPAVKSLFGVSNGQKTE